MIDGHRCEHCSERHPVCEEGKRLYQAARQLIAQFPETYDPHSDEQQQRLERVHQASDAYLAHIGQVVHRDRTV